MKNNKKIVSFQAGANMIVSGTAVTGSDNPGKVISSMKDIVNSAIIKNF